MKRSDLERWILPAVIAVIGLTVYFFLELEEKSWSASDTIRNRACAVLQAGTFTVDRVSGIFEVSLANSENRDALVRLLRNAEILSESSRIITGARLGWADIKDATTQLKFNYYPGSAEGENIYIIVEADGEAKGRLSLKVPKTMLPTHLAAYKRPTT